MDYLEGFLIGPVWSDTDYKSHRHFNAHLFLAFIMALAFAGIVFYPNYMNKWIVVAWPSSLIILIALILITPFLSSYYYRLPVYVKPLVLLLYAFKYVLLFYILTHLFLPLATLDNQAIPMMLLERMDRHINHMIDIIAESGGIFRTVLGIVAGTMWIVAEGLLLIITVIATPLISIGILKGLQYVLDRIVNYVLYQPIDEGVPVRVTERLSDKDVYDSFERTSTQNIVQNADVMNSPLELPKPKKQRTVTKARSRLKKRVIHSSFWTSMTSRLRALKAEEHEDPYVEEDGMYIQDLRGEKVTLESNEELFDEFEESKMVLEYDDEILSEEYEELKVPSESDKKVYPPEAEESMAVPESDRVLRTPEFEDLMIPESDEILSEEFEELMITSDSDEMILDQLKKSRTTLEAGDEAPSEEFEMLKLVSESDKSYPNLPLELEEQMEGQE